jgi:uncharacterized protein (DUF305 family)
MNKRIVIGAVALLLIGGGTYASLQKAQSTKTADAGSLVLEQRFMEQMTSHHEDAIQMADMAKEKAKNKQVQSLAAGIITAQKKEITDMKTWYRQWFGKDIPTTAAMSGVMMHDGMNTGKLSSATDFDLEFVSQMIPHHQKAVQMAKDILPKAKHSEIKQLANNIISSQAIEIQEMQQLKKEFQDNPTGTATRKAIDCGDDSPGC